MTSLLLVHGGWLDRHCWDLALPYLDDLGIDAHTVTLPGNGDTGISPFRASMATSAQAICTKIEEIDGPVAVLGHSMGGYAISAAAERCPEQISRMIYLAAWVPEQAGFNMLQMDKMYGHITKGPRVDPATIWRPLRGVLDLDHDKGAGFLCPLASAEGRGALFQHICPQPIRPGLSKVPWTQDRLGAVPKTYIECTKDVAIPLAGQRQFQRSAEFETVISLESDHSPFISMPQAFSRAVERALA